MKIMRRDKDDGRDLDHLSGITGSGAYPGARRGFGGGRYAAPSSGSYGGNFREDYRAILGEDAQRFPNIERERGRISGKQP